jgi:putative ABC transport system substrate-binding protein
MRRRELITLLGGAASWPLAGLAQETGKVRRIGFLRVGEPPAAFIDGFRRGLREVESLSRFAEEQHVISWFEET